MQPFNHSRRVCLLVGLSVAVLTFSPLAPQNVAHAQAAWPSKAIRIIVPYGAGGMPDTLARTVGEKISKYAGQPVVVENRPGAGGNIGAAAVATAEPDGHVLLMTNTGVLTANPSLYPQMAFDPRSDFTPVSMVAEIPLVLVISPELPVKDVQALLGFGRGEPGKLTYASPGVGSSLHLAMESLQQATGFSGRHIVYKSGPEAVLAVVTGQVNAMFADLPLVLQQVRAGKLRALAVVGSTRLLQLSDVPTIEESDVRRFSAASVFGLVAPSKTPKATIDKISEMVARAVHESDVEQRFAAVGVRLRGSSPAEFAAFIGSERQSSEVLIRTANIKLQ